MLDPNENAPWPRIAWLMSFPNSGTSYTLALTESATMMTTASNYGEHHPDSKGSSVPVYKYSPSGPFWISTKRDRPTKEGQYVLTKTHCSGKCHDCGPSKYITTPNVFLKHCAEGSRSKNNAVDRVMYDPTIVSRAVHLYRNPFDNIISRYHLELKNFAKKNETQQLSKYSDGTKGFRLFCKEMLDDKYYEETVNSKLIDGSLLDIIKTVPCYHDFIRYIQWHNFASLALQSLHLPTLILHYEDYGTNFDDALDSLLHFLGFDDIALRDGHGGLKEFAEGKVYMLEYFTESEIQAVQRSLKELAFPNVWDEIEHYFPDQEY
eukprot:CAMPEP_0185725296 /NCGR_PEP_ID=MMETSP1171-20130828/1590_1 /TAXON_ID=374046 /ORGANISM="Helicotheca tamensis, Strain CCMP826" /LENGTH=320 /DNA_ID=CAMNT_0028393385 /DNA_START=180 /DNA_END=1142 /DNA_ORIENTATION=-